MLNWFYNWIDPKILRLERWVNQKVIHPDLIDIDLDKVKQDEVRENNMFRQPPKNGEYGPFLTNLQGGTVTEYMVGPGEFEAFAHIECRGEKWWRHRDGGTTEDFRADAFEDMKAFFEYAHGGTEKFWECQLRTKALSEENPDGP